MLKKINTMALCATSAFALNTAEININDTDLELNAKFDMGQFVQTVEPDTVFVGGRLLNVDAAHSSTPNATSEILLELNFLMKREVADKGLSVGLGVKANATQTNNVDFISIPLGIEASYKIETIEYLPMTVGASVYYAPAVLAFADGDNYLEYRVNFDVEVIQNGSVTIGYRSLETNYNFGSYNYNNSVYGGFKFAF